MKQTAMQELKGDLVLTKETTKNSFSEIENQEIKDACLKVVEMTLNRIIKRIDDELLEMEKEQIIDFAKKFSDFNGLTFNEKKVSKEHLEKLFDELTFKSEI